MLDAGMIDGSLIVAGLGAVGTLAVVVWRLGVIEKNNEKRADEARENRKVIFAKLEDNARNIAELSKAFAEVRGYLQGKGIVSTDIGFTD